MAIQYTRADMPPWSSQEEPASSPVPPLSRRSQKLRKPPPITPRRFTKFFNPRSSSTPSSSRAGQELRDITLSGVNRRHQESHDLCLDFGDLPTLPSSKRRRANRSTSPCIDSSPLRSSPCQRLSSPRTSRQSRICLPIRKAAMFGLSTQWQSTTANFYTDPNDIHSFAYPALPFCMAPCRLNSLVAIGDEDGGVRLIETNPSSIPSFATPFLTFKPHSNAVMDLAFSSDDYLLATASGDQTASIVDMRTQTTISVLAAHRSSLKKVAFQPDSDNVVATCCRDGVVHLWDLRCSGTAAAHRLETQFAGGQPTASDSSRKSDNDNNNVQYASVTNSIMAAHPNPCSIRRTSRGGKPESPSTRDIASTTSLLFLPHRPHLFLTASDGSAQLRLWDIRGRYTPRRHCPHPAPLSQTAPLAAHQQHRHFGISSLSLSSDAARLYSVCKDNTVYAYSTNHLILGQASQLAASTTVRHGAGEQGPGPLYGIRHPSFQTSTFYVRSAIRTAAADRCELLALGSSDACALVLPTDERALRASSQHQQQQQQQAGAAIPLYEAGTPLVRGHSKEVTSVGWTGDGALVSIGDDYTARCWREDAGAARDLRVGGEGQGRRHRCGWADVPALWDDDEGD